MEPPVVANPPVELVPPVLATPPVLGAPPVVVATLVTEVPPVLVAPPLGCRPPVASVPPVCEIPPEAPEPPRAEDPPVVLPPPLVAPPTPGAPPTPLGPPVPNRTHRLDAHMSPALQALLARHAHVSAPAGQVAVPVAPPLPRSFGNPLEHPTPSRAPAIQNPIRETRVVLMVNAFPTYAFRKTLVHERRATPSGTKNRRLKIPRFESGTTCAAGRQPVMPC